MRKQARLKRRGNIVQFRLARKEPVDGYILSLIMRCPATPGRLVYCGCWPLGLGSDVLHLRLLFCNILLPRERAIAFLYGHPTVSILDKVLRC